MKKSVDEQYMIQYKETKTYWKRKRRKRALIYFILTIIGVITLFICSMLDYFTLTKYPIIFGIISGLTCTLRELIIPLGQEKRDLKHLEMIYNEERFKERNG